MRNFKIFATILPGLLYGIFNNHCAAQHLVYDLKQDWVYYDVVQHGFLPAIAKQGTFKAISFALPEDDVDQFYLQISLEEPAFLFYGNRLEKSLGAGITLFQIDSIKLALGAKDPFITIYGNYTLKGLSTLIVSKGLSSETKTASIVHLRSTGYNNFFIVTSILLLVGFVVLKTSYQEFTGQYFTLSRILSYRTVDELIYKIGPFSIPNVFMITWMSGLAGFLILTFEEVSKVIIVPGISGLLMAGFAGYFIKWLIISALVFLLFLFKYLLVSGFNLIFNQGSTSIHYANHLRLSFLIISFLGLLTLINHFSGNNTFTQLFVGIIIIISALRILLLFIRLTFISSNTILHLILYLCATEIIPTVLVFEMIMG